MTNQGTATVVSEEWFSDRLDTKEPERTDG